VHKNGIIHKLKESVWLFHRPEYFSMPIARCPVCEDILNFGSELSINQPVTCSTCLSNLKVVSVEPCELEEANRRPQRTGQSGQFARPYAGGNRRDAGAVRPSGGVPPANNRPPAAPPRDRRLGNPVQPPAFPPNPEKQVDNRRAQKWEKPKEAEAEPEEVDGYEEFEDKLTRNRGGKGKRSK
jgi:hypothetical protein